MRGERERRLCQPPAPFSASIRVDPGVVKLFDAACAGELVDVGGDPQQHARDTTDIDDHVAAVGMVRVGAQVRDRRVGAEIELREPACAVAQPFDLLSESLGDKRAAGELLITAAVRVLWCGPAAQRAQLTDRSIKTSRSASRTIAWTRVAPSPAAAAILRSDAPAA